MANPEHVRILKAGEEAVKKWQDANNVEQGAWWGYFGPKSLAKYNELAGITGEQEEKM